MTRSPQCDKRCPLRQEEGGAHLQLADASRAVAGTAPRRVLGSQESFVASGLGRAQRSQPYIIGKNVRLGNTLE